MGFGFHILSPYVSATLKNARQVVIAIPIIKITRTMVLSVLNTIKIKEHITEIIATVFLTVFETDMVGFPERNVNKDLFCILLCGVSKENSMNIIPNFYTNYVVGYNIDL